jgi:hypothetical protein
MGDCITIPAKTNYDTEVLSKEEVILLSGKK